MPVEIGLEGLARCAVAAGDLVHRRVDAVPAQVARGLGARTLSHGVFELTGDSRAIDRFFDQMRPFGVAELSRTGVLSITGGAE